MSRQAGGEGAAGSTGTLMDVLEATARRHPRNTAVVAGERRLDYAALAAATRLGAERFADQGFEPGSVVALVSGNSPELVVAFYALAALGCVVLPTNPALRDAEFLRGFAYAGVAGVVTTSELAAGMRRTLEDAPPTPVAVIGDGAVTLGLHDRPGPARRRPPRPHDDAIFQFTTGSMGRPKAVRRSHHNLVAEGEALVGQLGMTSSDAVLAAVPLFHSYGIGNCLVSAVQAGAALVLASRFVPRAAAALIEREGVTVLPGVPFIWNLLGAAAPAGADLSSLRIAISAGAPLLPEQFEVMARRFGVTVRQQYGCTEAGAIAVNSDDDVSRSAASVGRPIAPIRVRVLDERGDDCDPDQPGEVAVSSPRMARAYVGDEEPAGSRFHDGWFYPGDIATFDRDARLHLRGRMRAFVSTAGNKVDPREVEDVLSQCPGVKEAVVVGVRQRGGDEIVKAVVVPEESCSRAQVISHCRQALAEFKVPRVVEFRDALPRSPLGKVLRGELV